MKHRYPAVHASQVPLVRQAEGHFSLLTIFCIKNGLLAKIQGAAMVG